MTTETCPRCGSRVPTARLGVCPKCVLEGDAAPVVLGGTIELEEEIGRGGMGVVHRARHLRLGRTVAVKLLPESLAEQPEFEARFEREARAMAMLGHPHIVAVHDFGREGSQTYLVMEYVEAVPLAARLPMPPAEAAGIVAQVCDALAYAHGRGVIHRDIKPANVLVDAAGRVKVADFGIARLVGPEGRGWALTTPDAAVGTPLYLAPEALTGAPPDPRMDVYSCGVLLYELTTGRLPVGRFDPAPPAVDAIVRRALAADPARRYGSAEEMQRDLDAVLRGAGPDAADDLPADEHAWIRVEALLQSISTAVALWALLKSVTPRILDRGDVLPLIMVGEQTLPDGRLLSRARFETWWTLAALATFAVAITGYALIRRHWRKEGFERREPDRPVPQARTVFRWGVIANAVYAARLIVERSVATSTMAPYKPVLGGLIEVAALYTFWMALLHCWRIGRPFRREPLIWVGFGLALLPPAFELLVSLITWQPLP